MMATNTQANIPQTRHVPSLLLALFYTAVLYALATLAVYKFTLGSQLFVFWIATTGSTSLFVIIGFFATSQQHALVCRAVLRFLVVLQMYTGADFLPEELLIRLRQEISIQVPTAIVLVAFVCAIDCIYVFVTTRAASNDEGPPSIVVIFRRWIAHVPTSESSRNDNGGSLPVTLTEALHLQKPHAETDTGNLQTRLWHVVKKMPSRLLARTNTEKVNLQTRLLHMVHTMYRRRLQIDPEKEHFLEDPEVV